MVETAFDLNLEFPFVQSMYHLALAKVSVPLFFKYGSDILKKVMTDIQQSTFEGNLQGITSEGTTSEGITSEEITSEGTTSEGITSEEITSELTTSEGITSEGTISEGTTSERVTSEGTTSEETKSEGITSVNNYCRAQKALLFIPAHLRQNVVEAVNSIEVEINDWQMNHSFLGCKKTKFWNRQASIFFNNILYWRSDGTIDSTKTAQEMVRNKGFSIDTRFKMACKYCFIERIKTLWAEMVACGKSKNYATANDSIENFWIEWIRAGTPDNWTHAILSQSGLTPSPRYSSFFSSLQPEDRKTVIEFMAMPDFHNDDILRCLYAMTNEEKVQMLKQNALKFLSIFIRWPLQKYFLEMAEKVKNYIDREDFLVILLFLMVAKINEDYDYMKLFVEFVNIHSDYHNEILKNHLDTCEKLQDYVKEKIIPKILYRAPT